MKDTLLYAGIACILAAIVGGGFKGLGVEIPLIATLRRQILLALSGVAIIGYAASGKYLDKPPADADAETAAGLARYDAGDHYAALGHLKTAAEAERPEAQYHYGEMLWHGEGTEPNPDAGLSWVRRAASNGFPLAQASLASHLATAEATRSEAKTWAERSARQGEAWGHYVLASLAADPVQKQGYLRAAAEGGMPQAQRELAGYMMKQVRDDKTLFADIVDWLNRAAKQGDVASVCLSAAALYGLSRPADGSPRDRQYDEIILRYTLRCLGKWTDASGLNETSHKQIDGARQDIESTMPLDVRARVRQAAENWVSVPEGVMRHGHFAGRRR